MNTTFHVKKIETADRIEVQVPGSKSITNRALLLAAISGKKCTLHGVLFSDDTRAFLDSLQKLGFEVEADEKIKDVIIRGTGGEIPNSKAVIDVRSAGTAARFLTVMLALAGGEYQMNASPQMCRRPMEPLLTILKEKGVRFTFWGEEGHFPFLMSSNHISMKTIDIDTGISSQFASALLMSGVLLKGGLKVIMSGDRTEGSYIRMTLSMMEQFGIEVIKEGNCCIVPPKTEFGISEYQIEPDVSGACYFYAMAPLLKTDVMVKNVRMDSLQGDIKFVKALADMGCILEETENGVKVKGKELCEYPGLTLSMKDFSDQTMTMAAIAPFAKTPTFIQNVGHIRFQESDRIHAIVTELGRMGIVCEEVEAEEGIRIFPVRPEDIREVETETYEDHRMAMAFTLIGLKTGKITIKNPECCRKTFENYFELIRGLYREQNKDGKDAEKKADIFKAEPSKEAENRKRAVLAGVELTEGSKKDRDEFERSMTELGYLAESCFIEPVAVVTQRMESIHKSLYMGSGKIREVWEVAERLEADMIIFDNSLTPSQLRNIQNELEKPVVDRTTLILDIFESRARTREAKLQVESARLQYLLPRLSGMHENLSRQGGTSGSMSSRGSGEKKLELDRRRIEHRISMLGKELEEISKERSIQRKQRQKSRLPVVALVGYTNAGKSTIMNAMVDRYVGDGEKRVLEKNMLFATLDTATRRINMENNQDFLLADTVGFIHKLPHNLIKAFRSTLEEIQDADLLLQIVDYSDSFYTKQIETTNETLAELGAGNIPMITVYNKTDLRSEPIAYPKCSGDKIYISAKEKSSIELLAGMILESVYADYVNVKLLIPYEKGSILSYFMENAHIISQKHVESGTELIVKCHKADRDKYAEYIGEESDGERTVK